MICLAGILLSILVALTACDAMNYEAGWQHFYLNIVDPVEMRGSLGMLPCLFGGAAVGNTPHRILMPHSMDDPYGCAPLRNWTDVNGGALIQGSYLLLATGGNCAVGTQAYNAEQAGAAAAIIANCSPNPPFFCAPGLTLFEASQPVSIPSINIDWPDAEVLRKFITTNTTAPLLALIPGTGPIAAGDLLALETIVNNTYIGFDGEGGVRPWNDVFNPSLDPCVNRLTGLWCEGGRVAMVVIDQNNVHGTVHPAWGQLTQLKYLSMNTNSLYGTLPCELGNLANLQSFFIGSNLNITGLTPAGCISKLHNLRELGVNTNMITYVNFTEILSLPYLEYLDVSQNDITLPFPSALIAAKRTTLKYLDVSNNHFYGQLPSFYNFTALNDLILQNNKLSGELTADWFDDCAKLQYLDISINKLSGPAPDLLGAMHILFVDISSNKFSGPVPPSWGQLTTLLQLFASNNQLLSPILALYGASSLQQLDLSHNQLTLITNDPLQTGDFGAFISLSLPPSLISAAFDYNNLTGSWQQGWFTSTVDLTASHNQITQQLPTDLWTYVFQVLDLSYNNLTGSLPTTGGPAKTTQTLLFNGNPYMVGPTLPSWAITSPDGQLLATAGGTALCPKLTARIRPLIQFSIDPTYYNYAGCGCIQGTFGTPPHCHSVPVETDIKKPADNTTAWETFSDQSYGNSRMSQGVDTVWVINTTELAPKSQQPIRTVTLHISLLSKFVGANVLEVYQGGADLLGLRLAAFRGTDGQGHTVANTNVTVQAFTPLVSVHFHSPDTAGEHFVTSFSLSNKCPTGYKPVAGFVQCALDLPIWEISKGVKSAVYAVAAAVLAAILATFWILFYNRNTILIRAASRDFVFLILAFLALLAAGSVFYATVPIAESGHDDWICHIRLWWSCIPIMGVLGNLFAKTNRVKQIFGSQKLVVGKVRDSDVHRTVGILLGTQLVFLIVFSAMKLSTASITVGSGTTQGYEVRSCSQQNGFTGWIAAEIVMVAILLMWGSFLAFQTRDLPSAFNESYHILLTLFVMCFIGIVIVPVDYLIYDNPDAAVVIQGIGQSLTALVLTITLFGPKLYYIAVGRADDKSMTQTTAQTATPRASKQASGLGSARDLNASGGSEPNTPKGKGSNGSNGRKGSERSVRTHRTDSKSDIEMETVHVATEGSSRALRELGNTNEEFQIAPQSRLDEEVETEVAPAVVVERPAPKLSPIAETRSATRAAAAMGQEVTSSKWGDGTESAVEAETEAEPDPTA